LQLKRKSLLAMLRETSPIMMVQSARLIISLVAKVRNEGCLESQQWPRIQTATPHTA
jgi:hypothetical protein